MKKFRNMAQWVTWCADHPEWTNSISPSGAAAQLGISRQAIMRAIAENRIEAARLTDSGVVTGWLVPAFAIKGYGLRYGHSCMGATRRVG